MPTFLTPNRHGYSVRFSPFSPDRIAVATSQYYGLAGGGTLFLLELTPDGGIIEIQSLQWGDGLFDVVWSEIDSNTVITASGDGGLQLWNITNVPTMPHSVYKEHKKEVYSVDWSRTRQEQHMLSASWDCTVKLWDPNRLTSLSTYLGHSQLVYNAMFSRHIPNTFASVSGDGFLKLWNTLNSQRPDASIKAHDAEVLSCDWCKYEQNVLATAGSDGLIKGWDIRNMTMPIFELKGCEYAVRRIQFSPHSMSILASVSYDFTTRIWDFKQSADAIEVIKHHSEFTYGLDWNINKKSQLADCGWDSLVHIFTPRCLQT
ncbi:peroxisomal targeting signal 2 receptor [Ctenocephalides felis]|uniref:peroxisomal targeting signal 2 receptor n=1 Tax=Ctenocephalides felis TaxID=7515 RepID=UPI000E6E526D|nr:peroxisomal targeting signal 2 receptor [Ctenocephalides felis]XP_026473458.1 peroxisomal targeting signal 2 receptor [Ctenocephalides felis]